MWKAQAETLASHGYSVILPDLPGFGENNENFERFTIEEMAAQVLDLIKSLNLQKVIIGGLSMGGYVLLNLFRIAPEYFSGLILCDTTYLADTVEKRNGRFELILKIEKQGSMALAENMLPNLISEETKQNNQALTAKLANLFSDVNPVAAVNALQSMAERIDCTEVIAGIKVPTLLIFGEFDKITNIENAKKMKELIRESELQIIKHAGHYSNLEKPDEFNRILLDFCNRVKY
jgi:pimeloyl-ACP methyl ester carboxylesterase